MISTQIGSICCEKHIGILARIIEVQRRAKQARNDWNRNQAPGKNRHLSLLNKEIDNRAMYLNAAWRNSGCRICQLLETYHHANGRTTNILAECLASSAESAGFCPEDVGSIPARGSNFK